MKKNLRKSPKVGGDPSPASRDLQISRLPSAPAVANVASSPERLPVPAQTEQETGAAQQLCSAVGTRSPALATLFLNQAYRTLPGPRDPALGDLFKIALPALTAIAPRDELEGMLAVQLVALHNVAMDQLSRATISEQSAANSNAAVNNATKLLRAFSQQLEALSRYRGKGQQKVTVEHVHVNSGGQAIVGVVEASQGRGERE
ncbi:MAG: hypothetical protein LAQ69_50450 [Acidobacteriia bacterium]|nr:hypothetical protein [Terriglobia bacterium]